MALDTEILLWISESIENYRDPVPYITKVVLGAITVSIIRGLSRYFVKYRDIYFTAMSNLFAEKVIDMDYSLFIKHSCSKLITISETCWNLSETVSISMKIALEVFRAIITVIAISRIDPSLTIPVLVVYISSIPILKTLFAKCEDVNSQIRKIKVTKNAEIDQVINGFAEVRSFNTQTHHKESIVLKNGAMLSCFDTKHRLSAVCDGLIEFIVYIPTGIVMLRVIESLTHGAISGSEGIALITYVWRLISPILVILDSVDRFSELTMHLEDFLEIVGHHSESSGNIELTSFNNNIVIENLSFSYNGSESILTDINLIIKKGEKIGICGTSGRGKSTLLKLLPRFYDSYTGSIKIDGIDTRRLTVESLRSHISIVHQDTFILNGTIYENIICGNWCVSEYEVIKACKKAYIYDFIRSLPNGFETNVGPRGLKLSGGQKQRIALARTFLSNADIILLDEATSALDNESESIIQDSLSMFEGKTIIMVAHRLSTIKDCDKITVIDNHTIVECGNHEELLCKNGVYSKMYNA